MCGFFFFSLQRPLTSVMFPLFSTLYLRDRKRRGDFFQNVGMRITFHSPFFFLVSMYLSIIYKYLCSYILGLFILINDETNLFSIYIIQSTTLFHAKIKRWIAFLFEIVVVVVVVGNSFFFSK